MPPFKVVALDCDNTLWSGICGEDGCEGVFLDAPRRALQEFMVEQREAGMLLTMASKNNEQEVLDTFAAHPEMPLQLASFHVMAIELGRRSRTTSCPSRTNSDLGWIASSLSMTIPRNARKLSGALPEVFTLALPEDIDRTP